MEKYPYNIGTAVIYSVALLATLWWIPILGPIIIGYITGRKAGGPIKGLFAMTLPIGLYFITVQAIHRGLINIPPIINTYLGGTLITSITSLPFMDYLQKSMQVAMNVGTYLNHYIYYAPPSFFIMLSFAFIGGAVSRQVILERGIYREKKRSIKPFKIEEGEEEEEEAEVEFKRPARRRAPVEYNPEPQPVARPVAYAHHAQPAPQPYAYGYQPQYAPQYAPGYAPHPAQQPYPQYEYPQYPVQQEEYSPETPHRRSNKVQKQRTRKPRKKKQVKPFQTEENSKFVVHPMEQPKNINIKNRNRDHSIAFL